MTVEEAIEVCMPYNMIYTMTYSTLLMYIVWFHVVDVYSVVSGTRSHDLS